MIKMLIFDLDGTILDTMDDIAGALNYSLEAFGYKTHSKEKICTFLGNGAEMLTKRAMGYKDDDPLDKDLFDKFYNHYMNRYHETHCNLTHEFPHVKETLLELKRRGYHLGVISNKPYVDANPIIDTLLPNIFEFVVGTAKGSIRKPNKDMASYVYENYDIKPDEICYFGDSFVDADFSINCGFKYYLFEHGYGVKERLHQYNPEAFLNDFNELLTIFK